MNEIIEDMLELLREIFIDLELVRDANNKTAAQRVRVNTIKFSNTSRHFRKISIDQLGKKLLKKK